MILDRIDLIVSDVPSATAFFTNVVGLQAQVSLPRYAEIAAGPVTLMLSPDALVPVEPAAGVILHLRVDDPAASLERARGRGATVLLEPTSTEWGTETAVIAGPDGIVVDFYRPSDLAEVERA